MTHPEAERLQLYVEQSLGDADRLALDMHLMACPDCAEQVRTLRQLLHGLESLSDMSSGELSLPADFALDMAEEVAPSARMHVAPARRVLLIQAGICLIILLTSAALLTIVDTPVTDPSNDVLGLVDVLLGSPFQADANIVAVLAIMSLAGLAVMACVLGASPRPRPSRKSDAVPSRVPRRRQ